MGNPDIRSGSTIMFFIIFYLAGSAVCSSGILPAARGTIPPRIFNRYRNYNQMTQFLNEIAQNYSDFANLYTIGQSVERRELWVLRIRAPGIPVIGVPHVKFVGNIHGNEPAGRELMLYLAEYLLQNYHRDEEVKWILDRTIIHLLPGMNPDGFEISREGDCQHGPGRSKNRNRQWGTLHDRFGASVFKYCRENRNFVDLNRSFPDQFVKNLVPIQPETIAISNWLGQVPFVISIAFHGGALVANYPYDSNPENDTQEFLDEIKKSVSNGENLLDIWMNLSPDERILLSPRPSPTPDDDVFRYLASTYSVNHPTMYQGRTCNDNQPSFPGGITNGAAWYSFHGGMQDYNYVAHGCMELTLEISCCKYPLAIHLPRLWKENKKSMLEFIKQAQLGVRGLILDKETSAYIPEAVIYVSGRHVPFVSSKNGEFWRVLLPGNYILTVAAKGYESQSFPFTVHSPNSTHPSSTWLNIYLRPLDSMVSESSSNHARIVSNSSTNSFSLSLFVFVSIHVVKAIG